MTGSYTLIIQNIDLIQGSTSLDTFVTVTETPHQNIKADQTKIWRVNLAGCTKLQSGK